MKTPRPLRFDEVQITVRCESKYHRPGGLWTSYTLRATWHAVSIQRTWYHDPNKLPFDMAKAQKATIDALNKKIQDVYLATLALLD